MALLDPYIFEHIFCTISSESKKEVKELKQRNREFAEKVKQLYEREFEVKVLKKQPSSNILKVTDVLYVISDNFITNRYKLCIRMIEKGANNWKWLSHCPSLRAVVFRKPCHLLTWITLTLPWGKIVEIELKDRLSKKLDKRFNVLKRKKGIPQLSCKLGQWLNHFQLFCSVACVNGNREKCYS